MIKTETMTIKGKAFVKTYSDDGYMVERDGVRYSEAIDPAEFNRQYTETDELSKAKNPPPRMTENLDWELYEMPVDSEMTEEEVL